MRRTILLLVLTMLTNVMLVAALAHAGNHTHSGNHNHNNSNHQNKPLFQVGPKMITGNKHGLGFIADPVHRPLKNNTASNSNPTQGNFIADPLHLPTNNPTRVTPVVRDHSVLNPNPIVSPPRQRYDSIQGGGLGLDLNPFDFQAPLNFDNQPRDHRTTTTGFPGVQRDPKKGHNVWTPNTSGPANRSPVKP